MSSHTATSGHDARVAERRARAALAAKIHSSGADVHEIAAALGCSQWTVYSYLADPTNQRNARLKDSYRGSCERCGARTSGGDGPSSSRLRCRACRAAAQPRWTRESVIAALREWSERSGAGRLPSSYELDRAALRARGNRRAHLLDSGRYPSPRTCRRLFGSYGAAVAAAA